MNEGIAVMNDSTENSDLNNASVKKVTPEKNKVNKLPLARVKNIMKMDPDCGIISKDAIALVTRSTEMFIEYLAKESFKYTGAAKRKTVLKKDVDSTIDAISSLCFLDGALETLPQK